MNSQEGNFDEIKSRLDEIADLVSQEGIGLDEALTLYEEAVKLGTAACDASELGTEEDGEGEPSTLDSAAEEPVNDSESSQESQSGEEPESGQE